jgi:hypothetical protein
MQTFKGAKLLKTMVKVIKKIVVMEAHSSMWTLAVKAAAQLARVINQVALSKQNNKLLEVNLY